MGDRNEMGIIAEAEGNTNDNDKTENILNNMPTIRPPVIPSVEKEKIDTRCLERVGIAHEDLEFLVNSVFKYLSLEARSDPYKKDHSNRAAEIGKLVEKDRLSIQELTDENRLRRTKLQGILMVMRMVCDRDKLRPYSEDPAVIKIIGLFDRFPKKLNEIIGKNDRGKLAATPVYDISSDDEKIKVVDEVDSICQDFLEILAEESGYVKKKTE